MRKATRLFLVMTTVFIGGSVWAQQSKSEKDITQTLQVFTKALEDGDTSKLRTLTVESLSYGHSSGKIQNQYEFLKALADGSSDFVKIDISNQHIELYGNTAVVRQIFSAQTNDYGKPGNVKLKILLVWQKQKKDWKLLTRQAVKFVD